MSDMSLVDSVISDILPSSKYEQFDYGIDISEQQKQTLIENAKNANVGKNACLEIMVSLYGKAIKDANEIYGNKRNGKYEEYVSICLELSISTAKRILKCYEEIHNHPNKVLYDKNGEEKNLIDLGAHKLRAISSLPEDVKEKVYDNSAELFDMNVKEVNQLVKKVKETGEYNEDLLNEIRQKDDKIKTKEAETKQLQQEKEQKDQEIAELKAKLQKIEEAQPVAQVEPEVVEKIIEVEVEKVVKKEVIPDEIQEELKELRAEKKRLEQETAEKTEYIKQQDEKLQEKEDSLNNLKINKNTNQTENLNVIDIGILFTIIKDFLTRASSYTLLKGQYEDIPPKTKKTLKDAIKSVEDWCILMEQAVNSDFQNVGNNIIIESEND